MRDSVLCPRKLQQESGELPEGAISADGLRVKVGATGLVVCALQVVHHPVDLAKIMACTIKEGLLRTTGHTESLVIVEHTKLTYLYLVEHLGTAFRKMARSSNLSWTLC